MHRRDFPSYSWAKSRSRIPGWCPSTPGKSPSKNPMLPMLKKLASTATNIPSPWTYDLNRSKPGKNQLVSHFFHGILQTSTHLSIKLLNSFHTKHQKKNSTHPPKKNRTKQPKAKTSVFFVFVVNGAHLDALCRSSFWKLSHAASKGHPGGYFFPRQKWGGKKTNTFSLFSVIGRIHDKNILKKWRSPN